MHILTFVLLMMAFGLTSCGGVTRTYNPAADRVWPPQSDPIPYSQGTQTTAPKDIAIFFDGTGNDFNTTTNVGRMYQLTVNQNRNDIAAFYTSGVGADRTGPLGLATGLGFREDVQNAYRFLAENYAGKRDKIHLYGYSRGAFSARALAGFVHTVGIVDLTHIDDPDDRDRLVHDLFTAYKFARNTPVARTCPVRRGKPQESIDLRRCATRRVLAENGMVSKHAHDQVRFAMVGLWDTVETLGLSNGRDDITDVNWRYSDQICNMDKVAHAVSLHDNRAGSYTPILMTQRRLAADCDVPSSSLIKSRVNEVWFAGDHGQLGGTEPLGYLSGVSMNWMLDQARSIGVNGSIFPRNASVYAERLDFIKDGQRQTPSFRILFDRNFRSIRCYFKPGDDDLWQTGSAVDEIRIHTSVQERLAVEDNQLRQTRRNRTGDDVAALISEEQRLQVQRIDDVNMSTSECAPVDIKWVTN